MKKAYAAPCLAVESFQLDAAVAGSCSEKDLAILNYAAETCKLYTDSSKTTEDYIFGSSCAENLVKYNAGDPNDTLCYHAFQIRMVELTMYS